MHDRIGGHGAREVEMAPTVADEPLGPAITAPELLDPPVTSPWERYEDLGRIGRGGMGEVRRVRDRIMGRTLAMKLLPPEVGDAPGARARFLAEARLTACLQHPGIVPVHECGALPDGRLWFVMKEVRGRTLGALIAALHRDRGAGPSLEALRRALDMYLRVCEAVAYAHGRGVLHRDLKPDNVMIGELGEVLVMDWGIARVVPGGALEREAAVGAALRGTGHHTQDGAVLGTPAYMPPEQARGATEQLGPRSDVYALGAILHELLCGTPPYQGTAAAVWAQLTHGPPEPLAARCRRHIPEALIAISERAMARSAADRHPDALALAEDVRGFLDGARRRERAQALVAEARALIPSIEGLKGRARALRAEAHAALARVQSFDPVDEKARGWALEDEARALERDAALQEAAWQQRLHAALGEAPDLEEAHDELSRMHFEALCAAEEARDAAAAARAEALLRVHDRGRYAATLRGDGALTLVTEPDGAEVRLFRFVEQQRRLHLEPMGLFGRTPLRAAALPRGSYLLRIRAPGHREARYPVVIGRGEHWDGARPGEAEPHIVRLLPDDLLDEDDVYVPAGWFLSGGDPLASESLPRRRLWVDGFVLRRHPVTLGEYLIFLNDLVDQGREAPAVAASPHAARAIAGAVEVPLFVRDAAGHFQPGPRAQGWSARHPVASVDWHGAAAFAAWYAARTGAPWRLAGELEREKAARGVDGRFFPWGDQAEPTWACMVGCRPGAARMEPVDAHPVDESPYGVRGLAGNVRDWCVDRWAPDGPDVDGGVGRVTPAAVESSGLRSVRGGAWLAAPPAMCRAAGRFAAMPDERFSGVGLRLARPLGQ